MDPDRPNCSSRRYGRTQRWKKNKALSDLYERKFNKYSGVGFHDNEADNNDVHDRQHLNMQINVGEAAEAFDGDSFGQYSSEGSDTESDCQQSPDENQLNEALLGTEVNVVNHQGEINIDNEDERQANLSNNNPNHDSNEDLMHQRMDHTFENYQHNDEHENSSNTDCSSTTEEEYTSEMSDDQESIYNYERNDCDDFPEGDPNDELLYDGASITLGESLTAVFTYSVTNNLTGASFSRLLELISLLLPENSKFKNTTHRFMKSFEDTQTPMEKHYYCSTCQTALNNETERCDCGAPVGSTTYFIQLSVVDQLQKLLLKPKTSDLILHPYTREKADPDAIYDIYDGNLYREYVSKLDPALDKYKLSFTWYTDGAPVFKSKKYSIWPFYLIVNELPYVERIKKDNIIVAGIWFGPSDIDSQLYLTPLYEELSILHRGVRLEVPECNDRVKVQAILLAGTCDAPAKASVMCMKRFNGDYGCPNCLQKGSNISGETFGRTHVYLYEENVPERTAENYELHANEAESAGVSYGVFSLSILSKMMPDVIRGTSIDIMHCGYLGGVKKTTELWTENEFKYFPFTLYHVRHIIDARLFAIRPPASVKRQPRSISNHLHYFKASELKNWFFFYSAPILFDLFQDQSYFEHYLQLIMGLFLLNQKNITYQNIETSEKLLKSFVSRYQVLYGERFMTFNLHNLIHLPNVVKNLGPLWVTSCFPFEDLLGKTVDYIHGTRYVGLQIYSKVVKNIIIAEKLDALPNDSTTKNYCTRLLTKGKRISSTKNIGEQIFVLGKVKNDQNLPVALQNRLYSMYPPEIHQQLKTSTFHRLKIRNLLIHAKSYPRSTAHINYCIVVNSTDDEENSRIGFANTFLKTCQCAHELQCDLQCENAIFYVEFLRIQLSNPFRVPLDFDDDEVVQYVKMPYLYKFEKEMDESELIEIKEIKNICFVIELEHGTYIAENCDSGEYDQ